MKVAFKKALAVVAAMLFIVPVTACGADDSKVVGDNLSKKADNFEVNRRVVFFNGITDTYLLTIEGYCSITDQETQLEVTCKVGDDTYKKHFLGLSDNVTYFVEQLEPAEADPYHYKVVFKPEAIIPDVDLKTSAG